MIENLPGLFDEAELSKNWSAPLAAIEDLLNSDQLTALPDWLAVELIWAAVQLGQSLIDIDADTDSQEAINALLSIKKSALWQEIAGFDRNFPLLDQLFIRDQGVDIEIATLSQFLAHPRSSELSPHPLFDCEHYKYLEHLHHPARHPLVHFFRNSLGYREKSPIPNQYFASDWYCDNFMVDRFNNNLLLHYLKHFQDAAIRPNPHFHNNYVRQTQNLSSEIDPLIFYLKQIKTEKINFYLEGFSPCPYFDRSYYLAKYPDIKAAAEEGLIEPFLHFYERGITEGRKGHQWLQENIVTQCMIDSFQAKKKTAVLILGMHRSGTSALTRVLSLSGMDLATDLMLATDANESGYWESVELATIHDDILNTLDSKWDDILPIDEQQFQSESMLQYQALLVDYLVREFLNSERIVIKDPRMCRLLPIWLDVLTKLDVQISVVLIFRHPIEVAKSLQKRDGFLLEKSYLMWIRHVLDAEKYSRGLSRCFVNYSQLLTNPKQVVKSIANLCGIKGLYLDGNQAKEFIDAQFYHQRITKADLQMSKLSIWILDTFKELKILSENDADGKKHHDKFDGYAELLFQADKLFDNLVKKDS